MEAIKINYQFPWNEKLKWCCLFHLDLPARQSGSESYHIVFKLCCIFFSWSHILGSRLFFDDFSGFSVSFESVIHTHVGRIAVIYSYPFPDVVLSWWKLEWMRYRTLLNLQFILSHYFPVFDFFNFLFIHIFVSWYANAPLCNFFFFIMK